MTHEIDDSNKHVKTEEATPLIDFHDLERGSASSSTSDASNNDPYSQYRGLQALSQVLSRIGSHNSPGDPLKVPDNVKCVGDQCVALSLEDAAKEKAAIAASPGHINVLDHSKIPDNVVCVGNECKTLTPEEVATEKAKLAHYPNVELQKNPQLPDNVVCIGNECRELSPTEAAAERAKMQATPNTFEVYKPGGELPDNVKCIGNDCKIMTPEEIKEEKARYQAAEQACKCCVNCAVPENVKCVGNECITLSPDQVAAEKAALAAKGSEYKAGDSNVHISCKCCTDGKCADSKCCTPEELAAEKAKMKGAAGHVCSCCRVPDNVECIGDQCRVLSPQELASEKARLKAAGSSVSVTGCADNCTCCNKGGGGGKAGGADNAGPKDNAACVGDECRPISDQEKVSELNRLKKLGGKKVEVAPKAKIPDNVECVGNECYELPAAQAAAEQARIQQAKQVSWWLKY